MKNQYSISFEYVKKGKAKGTRYGDPHAVFIQIRKDQTRSTKVHIYQTDGVTDSIIPHWKTFDISELANVEILDNKPKI